MEKIEQSEDVEGDITVGDRKIEKEPRQRKKKLIYELKKQMEYYFSSANISKDRFMFSLCEKNGFVDLDLFLTKFNAIKCLTDDLNLLVKAVKSSSILELSEDKKEVRRSVPVVNKDNEMECTIYVENVPVHADHNWVRQVFSQYGPIDYISLPRFKQSGRPKGFCFIEFDLPVTAERALKAFGSSEVNPENLLSITTFNNEPEARDDATGDNIDVHHQVASVEETKNNKRKLTSDSSSEQESKKLKTTDAIESENIEMPSDTVPPKKKKKRKRNKKPEKEQEIDTIHLRVMSKNAWKKLRNKYLNIQKKHMMDLKKRMRNQYFEAEAYPSSSSNLEPTKQELKVKTEVKKPEYIPNAIIKICFENNPQDPRKLRETIREVGGSSVAYVDTQFMEKNVLVRFHTSEGAQAYLDIGSWNNMSLVEGDEEQNYWSHVLGCWQGKRSNKKSSDLNTNNMPHGGNGELRGKDKTLQRAFRKSHSAKNTHVIFED